MQLTRSVLAEVKNYDQYFDLSMSISGIEESELFSFLFSTAVSGRSDGSDSIAGKLLIDLEPKAFKSCKELILEIAASSWDVSNKEIPHYLVSQFGKWNLLETYNQTVPYSNLLPQEKKRAESIMYWALLPTASLSKPLHYWEWQEIIESIGE